jgi:hypothetical protein
MNIKVIKIAQIHVNARNGVTSLHLRDIVFGAVNNVVLGYAHKSV